MSTTSDWVIPPSRRVRGTVDVQGDKSISHRVAMLTALAGGRSTIRGFLRSEDCLNSLRAMQALGAVVEDDGEVIRVTGAGGALRAPAGELDMGNSGTSIRLIAGLLAGQPFTSVMTGDASLRTRPMGRIREPLEQMGARVELLGNDRFAPVRITGGNLQPITYRLPVDSAQVKSCVLLAGLFARGCTRVTEGKPTRDHTERLLARMGAAIRVEGLTVALESEGAPRLRAGDFTVPGDLSSAAFWLGAAAACPGGEVCARNLGLNPRRTAFLAVLRRMGASITIAYHEQDWEARGDVTVRGQGLRGTEVGGEEIPNLIDELPLIAMLGALAEGQTVIRDARELRVKESDRIKTTADNLRLLGVDVQVADDGLTVSRAARLRGGVTLDSHGDHRIAMGMAVLSLFAEGPNTIRDVACVATSYPAFWNDLKRVTGDA